MWVQLVAATSLRIPGPEGMTDGEATIAHAALSDIAPEGLLHSLIDDDRTGLLDHAGASLHIRGISRDAAHALEAAPGLHVTLRADEGLVVPAVIAGDEELARMFRTAVEDIHFVQGELGAAVEEQLAGEANALLRRKRAAEAVRALAPAAAAVQAVASGSYRAWREFVADHDGPYEHEETRAVAEAVLKLMRGEAPRLFGDLGAEGRR